MFWKLNFVVLSIAFCGVNWVMGQVCIPEPVVYLGFSVDNKLSWWASENCPETQYVVRIHTEGIVQYEYIVDTLNLDISFLNFCRNYNFTVTPLSDHILGMETYLTASIALPEDVDIAVLGFSTSEIDNNILLQWHTPENYSHCVTYYLVEVWDENSEDPEVLHIRENGYLLQHAPHCMKYRFQITAYYYKWVGTTGYYNYTMPAVTNYPTLVTLRQDATTINTTWSLESYSVNKCTVTNLYIQGTRLNVTIPIVDDPRRLTLDVSLPGLRADSMYYLNVTVENEAGISRPYQLAVQTLPVESEFEIGGNFENY